MERSKRKDHLLDIKDQFGFIIDAKCAIVNSGSLELYFNFFYVLSINFSLNPQKSLGKR